jgi:hypothetical protein
MEKPDERVKTAEEIQAQDAFKICVIDNIDDLIA